MKFTYSLLTSLYTTVVALLLSLSSFAQAPEKMSYQAVIRGANNALVTNQQVGMQISILQGSTAVYEETQTPTSNTNGLVSLEIGTGTVISGSFTAIDWSADTYFIKTETDPIGGTNYTITGTSQLLSVPFALFAKTSSDAGAVAANTAKVGYTEALVSANTDVAANTAKVGYTEALVSANTDVAANTAKVGYTEALVSANTDVAANTAKVGYTDALVSANADVAANTLKVSYTQPIYSVNTFYAELGGYVIEVNSDGTHGLVVAMQDQVSFNWYGLNDFLNNASSHDTNGAKFKDWRLPTKRELNLMYDDYLNDNGANLRRDYYWSSTSYDSTNAWRQYFRDGVQDIRRKDYGSAVRAVRVF